MDTKWICTGQTEFCILACMRKILFALVLVLTVSCLMSFDNRTDMAPTNTFTVTVLPDGQHKVSWTLNGDGRVVRSYNILYYYKVRDNRILSAQIRLTDTPQFPPIPLTGTLTWNPWQGNKHNKITYIGTICVFSDPEDPTQSECYYMPAHEFRK